MRKRWLLILSGATFLALIYAGRSIFIRQPGASADIEVSWKQDYQDFQDSQDEQVRNQEMNSQEPGNEQVRRIEQVRKRGLPPLLLGVDERGQAPLPDLFYSSDLF